MVAAVQDVFAPVRRKAAVPVSDAPATGVDVFLVRVLATDLLVTVILQRILLMGISIVLLTHFVALGVLLWRRRLTLSMPRLALFGAMIASIFAIQAVAGNDGSFGSVFLLILCYLPFLVVAPANEETYFEIIRIFIKVSFGIAVLVYVDLVSQIVGLGIPSMNSVVPHGLLSETYVYMQPLEWKAGIIKPNGFFMLEASFTAQFVVSGLILELTFFRRPVMLLLFGGALLGTFSGTGIMLLLLCLPVVAWRYWRQFLLGAIVVVPLFAGAAVVSGWYEIAMNRAGTFGSNNTSANGRFVRPYEDMWVVLTSENQHAILTGAGPGQAASFSSALYSAVPKVLLEYGIVTLALFLAFTTFCFFGGGVPFAVGWLVFLEYHLMGGYLLTPPILNYSFILAAGWQLRRSPSALLRVPSRAIAFTG